MKPRLSIILGAGASLPMGLPSTQDLTKLVVETKLRGFEKDGRLCIADPSLSGAGIMRFYAGSETPDELEKAVPIYREIYDRLKVRFEWPNFEHILAALDELYSLSYSQNKSMVDDYKHILSPFVQIDDLPKAMLNPIFLRHAREEIFRIISREFQQRLSKKDPSNFKAFKSLIDSLRSHFSLSVFTLNYDDLVEQTGGVWFDGFVEPGKDCSEFSRKQFIEKFRDRENVLCHLHGSILFGHSRQTRAGSKSLSELVRYETAVQALDAANIGVSEHHDKGYLVSSGAMISGFNKVAKLSYSPAPYGYYYKALADTLTTCPRLLIMGYGAFDVHVNTWIHEFIEFHGNHRKAIWITPRSFKVQFEHTSTDQLFCFLSGPKFRPDNSASIFDRQPGEVEFSAHEHLAICANGFPFYDHDKTVDSILKFLS